MIQSEQDIRVQTPMTTYSDGVRQDVQYLWKVFKDQERYQDELTLETVRIRERMAAMARAHEDMFLHESDIRRMLKFQFKELHKMLNQSFEKSLSLALELSEIRKVVSNERQVSENHIHDLNLELQKQKLQNENCSKELELTKQSHRDMEQRVRALEMKLLSDGEMNRKFQQNVEVAVQAIRDRLEYLQSNLSSGLTMQDSTIKQLQVHFRDNMQSAQQISEGQQSTIRSDVQQIREKLEKLTKDLSSTSDALQSSKSELESKIVAVKTGSEVQSQQSEMTLRKRLEFPHQ